jgi:glycosyltransferase involved in cell wall biosynthesis
VYGKSGPSLRVAHVTDFYLPRCGGIELQVRDLAHRQAAAGYDVTVITATPGGAVPLDRGGSGEGVQVRRLAESGLMPGQNPEVRAALRATLRAGRFDVVHVHAAPWSPFAFTAAALADERPTVLTMHSILGPAEMGARLLRPFWRFHAWPVVWTAVSDVAARPLRRLVGDQIEVHVLPNGVDVPSWRVRPTARETNDVVALAVMRLTGRKRGLPLLRVLKAAREQLPADVRLRAMIIGDGPKRSDLERFLVRHDMTEDVVLAGRRPRADVRTALARADVFLAPAILESFGIAALEARCAGVPVVARAESGTAEFIRHGREGLLADSDAAMAYALAALAADPAARARIAAHNRTVAPASDWNTVLERTASLYRLAGAVTPAVAALEAVS